MVFHSLLFFCSESMLKKRSVSACFFVLFRFWYAVPGRPGQFHALRVITLLLVRDGGGEEGGHEAVFIMIAEEQAHGIIFVDLQDHAVAVGAADVLKRSDVHLRNILPVDPLDLGEDALFGAFILADVGVAVDVHAGLERQRLDLAQQVGVAVAAVMMWGCCSFFMMEVIGLT